MAEKVSNQTCQYKGTARYMAPEVKACKRRKEFYSPRMADIYSLGICFFGILYDVPKIILENPRQIRTRMLEMEILNMNNYTFI